MFDSHGRDSNLETLKVTGTVARQTVCLKVLVAACRVQADGRYEHDEPPDNDSPSNYNNGQQMPYLPVDIANAKQKLIDFRQKEHQDSISRHQKGKEQRCVVRHGIDKGKTVQQ